MPQAVSSETRADDDVAYTIERLLLSDIDNSDLADPGLANGLQDAPSDAEEIADAPRVVAAPSEAEGEAASEELSLIARLEKCLEHRDPREEERERVQKENKRFLIAAAAENRRWQQEYRMPGIGLPSLLKLAEQKLGDAFTQVGDQLSPHFDYCALVWKPSAVDHNGELCRIEQHRPAAEGWS